MLKKYQDFRKVLKTPQCCFYEAVDSLNRKEVLVKRVRSKCTWDQVLKSKSVKYDSVNRLIPSVLEIYKSDQHYFFVMERPTGSYIGKNTEGKADRTKKKLVSLGYQLVEEIIKLREVVSSKLVVLPEWAFLHNGCVKICHFEPLIKDEVALKRYQSMHVQTYKQQNPEQREDAYLKESSNLESPMRDTRLVFNLGLILYHIATGEDIGFEYDFQVFLRKILTIQKSAHQTLLKKTGNKTLTYTICRMISSRQGTLKTIQGATEQEQITLKEVFNIFQLMREEEGKKQFQSKGKIVNVFLEKIDLDQGETTKKKVLKPKQYQSEIRRKGKFLRPCCQIHQQRSFQFEYEYIDVIPQNKYTIKQLTKRESAHRVNLGRIGSKQRERISSSCMLPKVTQNLRGRMPTQGDALALNNGKVSQKTVDRRHKHYQNSDSSRLIFQAN